MANFIIPFRGLCTLCTHTIIVLVCCMYYVYCMICYRMLLFACAYSFLNYCYDLAVLSLLIYFDNTWSSSLPNMTTYTVSLQPSLAFRFTNGKSGRNASNSLCRPLACHPSLKQDKSVHCCTCWAKIQRMSNISSDGRKSYSTVMEKLKDFFKIRKNVIYEHACFN